MSEHVLLTFTLCDQRYALSIDEVVEVAALVESAGLGMDAYQSVHGVVIRRGEPMLLVDLRRVFHCEQVTVDVNTLFIVVKNRQEYVGFLVDSVQGVLYLAKDVMRPVHGEHAYIQGVAAHSGDLIQWLQVAPILEDTLPEDE